MKSKNFPIVTRKLYTIRSKRMSPRSHARDLSFNTHERCRAEREREKGRETKRDRERKREKGESSSEGRDREDTIDSLSSERERGIECMRERKRERDNRRRSVAKD